jgi:lysozyme family protein
MEFTFDSLRDEYSGLWQGMTIHDDKIWLIDRIASRLMGSKLRYETVAQVTGVPWFIIATLHEREASGDFQCHLHNGDPLGARTRHVPSGRPPPPENPPFTWEQSACDALALDDLTEAGSWSLERACYEVELFNGFGYRRHGINSPYLWSFSDKYSAGKFVADGEWSASAVDAQCGVMPLIKRMMAADVSVAFDGSTAATLVSALSPAAQPASATAAVPVANPAHTTVWLQNALNSLGAAPRLVVDGNYGPGTKRAVRQFQAAHGLQDDGIAGPVTCAAIAREFSVA